MILRRASNLQVGDKVMLRGSEFDTVVGVLLSYGGCTVIHDGFSAPARPEHFTTELQRDDLVTVAVRPW